MAKRELVAEGYDRHGHWSREYSLRGEGWSVIEHWAGEYGFGLIHFKGNRRIYRRGDNPKLYVTFVEFRLIEEENRLCVSSWIEAGWIARLLNLLMIEAVVDLKPNGFWAVRVRRTACHAMNSLLLRMRQPQILGSTGWHWGDLDLTTVLLAFSSLGTAIPFVIAEGSLVRVEAGLSRGLLEIVGESLARLSVLAFSFLIIQQWVVVRRWTEGPAKLITMGAFYAAILVSAILLFTQSKADTSLLQVTHYCVQSYSSEKCSRVLDGLSAQRRQEILGRLFQLEEDIARRESSKHSQ